MGDVQIHRLTLLWIVLAILASAAFGQTGRYVNKKFTSKSGSFTIELAEAPSETPAVESGDEIKLFKCARSISYYSLGSAEETRFVLREIDVSGCQRTPEDFATDFRLFFQFLAGPNPKVHSDRVLDYSPHEGARDVLYESGAFYPGTKDSPIYNRVRAIDGGTRLFILTYFRGSPSEEDLIFNSFRVAKEFK